jgi:S-adenosylmethionine:tRNA ribosyltransferase-isomerase
LLLSDFDFHLPEELIAQQPLADRAASRMLVVDRERGCFEDRSFRDFPSYLNAGDCLVLNDSRVFPSRLFGHRARTQEGEVWGGEVEVFLTKPVSDDGLTWTALVWPGKKMRTGERIVVSDELSIDILGRGEFGERTVRLHPSGDLFEILDRAGHVPLPPYIRRADSATDRERYQTVFARERGSVAAPTAGLHFTPEILNSCRERGAAIATITLHVGLGTFQPLRTEVIEEVKLHSETFVVPREATAAMDAALHAGKRVVAVGTTAVRAVESAALKRDATQGPSETELFISPGFRFRRTGGMLTNFHLPKSSLLVLVSAFAGRELILEAYRHAVAERYRFFSYGDCMLIV